MNLNFTICSPFHRIIWGSFFSFSVLFPWVHLFPRYMRHAFSLLTPVASRLRCMTGNGPRRVAALGGCLGLLLGGSLLAGCDSDSANFAVFWHVNVGDPNFASPSPGPLPSSPPAPADSLHTFSLYFIAFFLPSCVGLRYSGSPPGRLAGSRSPVDSTEKSCFLPLYLPAADVSSTSHCQVTLFGSIVFSNAHSGLTKHDVPTAFPRMFYTGEDTP